MVYFFLDKIVLFMFGSTWLPSVEIGRIILISAFFSFIFTPLDKGAVIMRKNAYYFLYQAVRVTLILNLFFFNSRYHFSLFLFICLLTGINSLMLMIDFFFNYHFSKLSNSIKAL